MQNSDQCGGREEGAPEGGPLPISATLTLAEALRLLYDLERDYGAQARIDLDVRLHRLVRLDRAEVCAALLERGHCAYLCIDVRCPRVGAVVFAPREPAPCEAAPLHLGRRCALWPLSPPPGVEVPPEDVEQYALALLDELNPPSGDAAYRPEATWEYAEGGRAHEPFQGS